MEYLTINKVIKMFNDIQVAHPMLRSYGYGQLDKLEQTLLKTDAEVAGESEPSKMPFMWVTPITTTGQKGMLNYNIEIFIGDLVREADQNENDVESDAHSICMDIVATLHNYLELQPDNPVFMPTLSFNTTSFYDRFENSYAGQILTFQISTKFDFDYCEVPKN